MRPGLAYVLGVSTTPVTAALVLAWIVAWERTRTVECGRCQWTAGELGQVTRWQVAVRWTWHNLRRHGRVQRVKWGKW